MTPLTTIRGLVKGLRQSVLSLSFNLGGILAGTLLASHLEVFSIAPWILPLFPGILSVRGAVGGLFSARLSTGLRVGTIEPSFTKNTRDFRLLLSAIITLTFGSSTLIGVTAVFFGVFSFGITTTDLLTILAIIIATMGLSLLLISPVTLGVSILSVKRGLDPDVIVYPIISTVADISVTLCYIFVLRCFESPPGWTLVGLFDLFFLFTVGYLFIKNNQEEEFVKTVKEFLFTLLFVAFIVNVTGLVFSRLNDIIGNNPKLFVVYPALITTIGGVGAIVGSTATTKLALGMMELSLSSIKHHLTEIGSAWAASLIMFTFYATIASAFRGSVDPPEFVRFIVQLLITNFLAVTIIILISFTVAIYARKKGLDPDNFVIPIESSLADSVTTISLLLALIVIG